jgi:uncharacterized protein (DUF2252 family)
MNIHAATKSFEAWLGAHCTLNCADLDYKHRQMAKRKDPFPFFRGTYYRWAQLWPKICADLDSVPRVLSVGDVHLENFGTWRDANGRLIWGVNDFDEAADLPYANDLVRLAASVRFACYAGPLDIKLAHPSAAIECGYRKRLAKGGAPFVLEEHHRELREMAMTKERDPKRFWRKLTVVLDDPDPSVPKELKRLSEATIPTEVDPIL